MSPLGTSGLAQRACGIRSLDLPVASPYPLARPARLHATPTPLEPRSPDNPIESTRSHRSHWRSPPGPARRDSIESDHSIDDSIDHSIQGGSTVGSVIKKRRKKMRKHKQRKLLKRQRHKK
jgi:hypothetical protein